MIHNWEFHHMHLKNRYKLVNQLFDIQDAPVDIEIRCRRVETLELVQSSYALTEIMY